MRTQCPYCDETRPVELLIAHIENRHPLTHIKTLSKRLRDVREALGCPVDRDPIEYVRELRAELERLKGAKPE